MAREEIVVGDVVRRKSFGARPRRYSFIYENDELIRIIGANNASDVGVVVRIIEITVLALWSNGQFGWCDARLIEAVNNGC